MNVGLKGLDRVSDITLADFWKAQDHTPDLYDNKGTSLVVINSPKGEEIWRKISPSFRYEKTVKEIVLKTNANVMNSVAMPEKREKFFNNLEGSMIAKLKKITQKTFSQRVKGKIESIFHARNSTN